MKIILIIVFVVLSSISVIAQEIDISRLYVQSSKNTGYVLDYAVTLIPTYKKVSKNTINCAITELKKSGMFKDIKVNLILDTKGEYYLVLKPVYKGNLSRYVITEISVEGFQTKDKEVILEQLERHNVKKGELFTSFLNIRRTIVKEFADFDTGKEAAFGENIWYKAYLKSPSSIHLVIMRRSVVQNCPTS